MQYQLLESLSPQENDCLVLGLCINDFSNTKNLNTQQADLITGLFAKLSEPGDFLWQTQCENYSVLLLHCGKKEEFNAKNMRKYLRNATQALLKQKIPSATFCLPKINEQSTDWQLEQMLLQIDAELYQLLDFKSQEKKPPSLETVQFCLNGASEKALRAAEAIAAGIRFTRHLADLPANICTPTHLADQAEILAKQNTKIRTKILKPEAMHQLGMGALLAVAKGSIEEPRFIEMHYQGSDTSPIVLIGKGITFDSGGLSIKPANMMDEMKYDMAGAASVFGIIKTCALLDLPINVIGLVASAENLPSGSAVKPGDIVSSLSGQTIEILNTDAEGRLALADALTYAEQFNPKFVIDLATLTGAMVVALGSVYTGFMTENEALAKDLLTAAKDSGDKLWRMPLDDAYQEALESPLADMINASFDRSAGAIVAACFLSRFSKKFTWAHLDIAGTAWISGKKRAATGRPVALIIELLRHAANSR